MRSLALQGILRKQLWMLGLVVSFVVLATGAHVAAVQAFKDWYPALGREITVAPRRGRGYGALFVAVLLFMYAPAASAVRAAGEVIVQRQLSLPAGASFLDRLQARSATRIALGVDPNVDETLQRAVRGTQPAADGRTTCVPELILLQHPTGRPPGPPLRSGSIAPAGELAVAG
jgi:hypothetical protein